jgi:hypothetical protein
MVNKSDFSKIAAKIALESAELRQRVEEKLKFLFKHPLYTNCTTNKTQHY